MKALLLLPAPMKDKGISSLVDTYLKRASATYPASLKIIKGEKVPPKGSPGPYLEKEAQRILQATPPGYYRVALQPDGKLWDSVEFSKRMVNLADRGTRGIVFWVGSAYGLAPSLVQEADLSLSLSPMTFPHQLAVAMLAEQLYRAHAIASGSPYHK